MTPKAGRAEPLSPEARRLAIVEAVIPLLVDRGAAVTTAQMAEAAGIAEGTIFRVFPDKGAVIDEAIRVSIDPEPVQRQLSQIYTEAPLEAQLTEAALILIERFKNVVALLSIVRTLPRPEGPARHAGPPPFVAVANAAINDSLTELFERHRDRLRIESSRAAAAFRGLILAAGHPSLSLTERLTVDEIVAILLTGIALPVESVVI
jgi:AcrR family transcriptional regulator